MGKRKRDEAEKWVINEGDDIIETEKSDRSERFRVFYQPNFEAVIEARDFGENDQIEMAENSACLSRFLRRTKDLAEEDAAEQDTM
ncbi:hypothetical protein L3X38_015761 [Prunus dulcis]|uniref:Uncharacterized protein n=1 Tax=Prunus dulcis TaxID=3755 RepID=A0AAD4W515_PRUDU|nr:hypothetical protein L3X38_015761 [Prunus dulcis]